VTEETRGRPRRVELPEGIGEVPDGVVAAREGMTTDGIRYLRRVNDIPPAVPHGWDGAREWARRREDSGGPL
jgi:hypothetical protein